MIKEMSDGQMIRKGLMKMTQLFDDRKGERPNQGVKTQNSVSWVLEEKFV